jgi:hypothetical protein
MATLLSSAAAEQSQHQLGLSLHAPPLRQFHAPATGSYAGAVVGFRAFFPISASLVTIILANSISQEPDPI